MYNQYKAEFDKAKKKLHTQRLIDVLDYFWHQRQFAIYNFNFEHIEKLNHLGGTVSEMLMPEDYRRTLHWQDIRQKTLADHPRCITCKRHAECAHHNQYHEILFVERPGKDVVSMCHDCHQTFHENRSVISFHEIHELKRVN